MFLQVDRLTISLSLIIVSPLVDFVLRTSEKTGVAVSRRLIRLIDWFVPLFMIAMIATGFVAYAMNYRANAVRAIEVQTEPSRDQVIEAQVNKWLQEQGIETPKWRMTQKGSPACSGTVKDGAFYCGGEKSIFLTPEGLSGWGVGGIVGMPYLMGHEAGHHVQNMKQIKFGTQPASERYANCSSGVFVRWLVDTKRENFSESDIQSIRYAMEHGIVDEEHGPTAELAQAFMAGYEHSDLNLCANREKTK